MTAPTKVAAPCGTMSAYTRHRRHDEPIDDACRVAWRTYAAGKRDEKRAARRAPEERRIARVIAAVNRIRRQPSRVTIDSGQVIAVGALAGTTVAHGQIPDPWTGSSCLVCFGWVDDYRHTHRLRAIR